MIVAEFGSTAAVDIFVFHALEAENGRNPLRLARLPVLMLPHATPAVTTLVVRLKLDVAVCNVGVVESVTVTETVAVPTAVVVPVIAPVELLIDNPLGRPLAVNVYGAVPPDAVTVPE
jgi:hypothetical protein